MTTILVVEDEPLNLELLTEILNSMGIMSEVAENGENAIKSAGNKVYDLILMDIGLPGIDGIEAMRIIRNDPRYKEVPIIAITSYAMKGDKERLLAAGFDDYIPKPVDITVFMEKLNKYRK